MTDEEGVVTLTEFLLARIAEDEAVAQEARQHEYLSARRDSSAIHWEKDVSGYAFISTTSGRILAECEAHRRIVHDLDACDTPEGRDGGEFFGLEIAVQHMASVYADHPDYREEWKP